ncbi:MAG TPA: hypothetical protein VHO92_09840 [Methanobacterium sp.]|nr:hypothetical protein [Methanobacterium sp.]
MQEIILVTVLFASFLFFMGTAAAAVNNTSFNLENSQINSTVPYSANLTNSTNISSSGTKKTQNTFNSEESSGCCSVLVHVKKGVDVFSYRRDSTYAANLHIIKTKWYGKQAVKEYKITNGYFFHTIITRNGWIVSTGGPDIVWITKKLESIAGRASVRGHIKKADINSAYALLRKAGLGHFLIKDSAGNVGLATYKFGHSKTKFFKMKDGEYVSVPNSPTYYRQGIISKNSNPVSSAIHLAGTDRYGINRRNIITYKVQNIHNSTEVNIWASYDGGKLIKRYRGKPDNIIFRGHEIYAGTLPRIPSKKYIGKITLMSYNKLSVTTSSPAAAKT